MSGRARLFALGLLLLVTAPVGAAGAADPPADSHGRPTQDGWWNRLQGPAEGEPEGNPVRPLVPPVAKPPNVPGDAIVASAGAGQADKVAAVGVDVALAGGTTLGGLTLRLKESPAGGANVGADKAKIAACPATVPWGPAQNAAWRERPTADCGLAAADGVRAADGTWTFDLTAIGRLWSDPFAPLAPNGVVLTVDPAGSPSPVQVSWLNVDSGNVSVDLQAAPSAPGPAADVGPPAPEAVAAAATAPAGPYPDRPSDARSFPPQRGGVSVDPLAYPSGLPTFAAVRPLLADGSATGGPAPSPSEVALAAAPSRPDPDLRARPAVDFWEHVPGWTALLVPVAAGIAVLVGVVLGPIGRPSPVFRREGGLSRALTRRNRAGSDVTS
jgi:hypothetical protein